MKNKIPIIFIVLITMLLVSCNKGKREEEWKIKEDTRGEESLENGGQEVKKKDEIGEILDKMTLEEKIGQLFIFGFNGTQINEDIINLIEKNHIGGFILFKDNIESARQTMELLNQLKSLNKNNPLPLFLSLDEEGGRVSRLPKEFPKMPAARKIGNINKKELSFQFGKILGHSIGALGFNMDFAPVLDINSNPKNPVIGDRAFGSQVDQVVNNAIETMKGLDSENIIPVVKHFPGHGDTSTDSHIDIPLVNKSLDELESLELIPFTRAIEEGVDIIMVGHILFPQIDREYPASMSKPIIGGILRTKLNFNGVVITDDLNMGAIMKNYSIYEAVREYFKAGGDIALICHGGEEEFKVFQYIKEEVEKGNLKKKEIDEKVYRIIRLKKKYNLEDNIIMDLDMENLERKIKTFLREVD